MRFSGFALTSSRAAAVVIVLVWIASIALVSWWGYRYFAAL